MGEEKEGTSSSLNEGLAPCDSNDVHKSLPSSSNSSTHKHDVGMHDVVLFPIAVTFLVTWWFIPFVDGFFSPIYARLGFDKFGLGFITSLLFIFFVGIFASSWLGASVFWLGEWFIKRMPFIKRRYSASKQISAAISPDQNTTAFKEFAIIRHPRLGEYAFGFITSSVILQISLLLQLHYTYTKDLTQSTQGYPKKTNVVKKHLVTAKQFIDSLVDATRNFFQQNFNAFVKLLSGILGGSADLVSSNKSLLKMYSEFQNDTSQKSHVSFCVREHVYECVVKLLMELLTSPITILNRSFERNNKSRHETCY
ncbi:hypothetical protein CRYUN_Cryun28dG0022400 [Craigia yunnanensis]